MQKNNEITDKYLSQQSAEYYESSYKMAEKLLKRLINMKSINKFEVEKVIHDAKRLIYPTVHLSNTFE